MNDTPDLGHPCQQAIDELKIVRDALQRLYEETADYIRLNNLGDVHHNRSMQMARDALALDESFAIALHSDGTMTDMNAIPRNDLATLERAVAYCQGQAMHFPDNDMDDAYDRGVAACVRMLEDMMPYHDTTPPEDNV